MDLKAEILSVHSEVVGELKRLKADSEVEKKLQIDIMDSQAELNLWIEITKNSEDEME